MQVVSKPNILGAIARILHRGIASSSLKFGSAETPETVTAFKQFRKAPSSAAPLDNSLSGANYPLPRSASSITDPDYFLQNSMSDSLYEMPRSLVSKSGGVRLRPHGGGFRSANVRPTMQRIIVAGGRPSREVDRLQNSLADGDYK